MAFPDLETTVAVALRRRQRYLLHYGIVPQSGWDILKSGEEGCEFAESVLHAAGIDRPDEFDDTAALAGVADEAADFIGMTCLAAAAHGLPPAALRFEPLDPAPSLESAALRVIARLGHLIKGHMRLTDQARPTGKSRGALLDAYALAISDVFAALDAFATMAGIDLDAAFDNKWAVHDRKGGPSGAAT